MLDRLTGSPDKKAAFYAAVPMKRGGTPEEIADAILFVASERAPFHYRADHPGQRRQDRELSKAPLSETRSDGKRLIEIFLASDDAS